MAKQVADLKIGISIDGYENFDKLKSAFKGLSSAVAPASQDITKARQAILEFGNANTETTRLVNAQIAGLKNLQTQVAINGSLYKQLGSDIDLLKSKFTSTTQEITQATTVLDKQGSRVFGTSIDNLKKYNSNLQTTQRELAATAKAVDTTSTSVSNLGKHLKDTQNLKVNLNVDAGQVTQARGKVASTLALLRKLGEQSTTAVGAVGRTTEGIAAAGITGLAAKPLLGLGAGAASSGASFLSGLSERVTGVQDLLNRLPFGGKAGSIVSGIPESLAQQSQSLGGLETRLSSLQELVNSFTTTLGTIDPKAAVATGAVITAFAFMRDRVGNEMDKVRKDIDQSFTAISDDVQNLLVALQRLGDYLGKLSSAEISGQLARAQQAFASVPAGSPRSRSFASQIAGLENIQREENAAAAAVLEEYRQRVAGTTVSVQTLGDRISYVRTVMQGLDTSTTEGSAAHAQYSSTVRDLERQLNSLATAYTHVSDFARAATADINTANTAITQNYLNRGGVVREQNRQAAAMQELRQAVTTGVQGTPLLLPAAGQTSAPGTGLQYSGQSVRLGRRPMAPNLNLVGQGTERFFGAGELGIAAVPGGPFTAPSYGPVALPEQSERARRSAIAEGDAQRVRGEAAQAAEQRMEQLRAAVDKASQANTGSISSLNRLRQALGDIRQEVVPTDAAFRKYTQRIETLDRQIARTQGGRGLGGRQLAQIGGAAISGGIFGGVEGFLGGVAGGIFGGVGGSFAGAAAGAQVGMLRQQLAGTAEYAAQIGKLQIALRGVAGTQGNYTQAINAAAAATRELNIPQVEATQGITRLSAAVLGAGGSIGDANFAFRAISESIKATGGNAEQVDGALLALTQVFSKGKVSAEELNQIAERLPGTFTLFAKAAGKSGPELQKALQQGQVGLNDLMKFLELASSKYGQSALDIASSSEEAGARMKITFDQMRLEVGKALQPIGAELQKTFAVFAKDITPTVIAAAQGIASALKTIMDNAEAIGTIAKLGAAFFATKLAIQGFVAMRGALGVMSLAIQSFFGNITAQAAMAGQQIKRFAASIAAPLLISVGIVGVESVISEMRRVEEARKSAEGSGKVPQGEEFIRQAGGDTLNSRDLARLLRENDARFNIVLDDARKARQEAAARNLSLSDARDIVKDSTGYSPRSVEVASQLVNVENQLLTLQSRRAAILKQIQTAKPPAPLPNPTAANDAGGTEAERAARQAAETERRLAQEGITIQMNGQLKAHEYAIELDRRRYELQKQLSDEANAHEIANLQGGARTIAQAYATYRSRIAEIERGLVEAAQNTGLERRRLQASQAIEGVTTGTGMQGRYRQGSIGPSTGPHFDIKQVGGGRFARTDLDQYVQVNGRPLSSGLTVPGGTFDAPRAGRPRHGGIDYAFGDGAALELKGGAQWVKLDAGTANGDVATLKLPDGRMFTVLHGKFERTAAATAPTAQGRSQLLREQKTAGKTDFAELGVSQAEGLQQAGALVAEQQKTNAFRTLVDTYTQSIRDQNYELSNSNTLNVERNRLLAAGASSKYIDYAMRLVEVRRTEADMLNRINLEEKDPEKRAEQIRNLNALYAETRDLLRQNYELSTAFDNSLGLREGAQRYVESIGTLREATAGLAQQGFKGIEDSIVSLATTGTANFAQFATSLLNDMARIIIQQFVMKQLTQAIMGLLGGGGGGGLGNYGVNLGLGFNQIPSFPMGSALPSFAGFTTPGLPNFTMAKGGVFAANGIVPYAMGGIVNRPTLFPFANGGAIGTGLMGEAGPEAIMPLTRGANGKLGVMAVGGGTTNVVVNVDASGGSTTQGKDDNANQLGKVIAAAVQQELVRQRRPGGLLA